TFANFASLQSLENSMSPFIPRLITFHESLKDGNTKNAPFGVAICGKNGAVVNDIESTRNGSPYPSLISSLSKNESVYFVSGLKSPSISKIDLSILFNLNFVSG